MVLWVFVLPTTAIVWPTLIGDAPPYIRVIAGLLGLAGYGLFVRGIRTRVVIGDQSVTVRSFRALKTFRRVVRQCECR
jgi:hypothetical protein